MLLLKLPAPHLSKPPLHTFFALSNVVGLGFPDRHAVPITSTINSDLDNRPFQIYYFSFCSSISPSVTGSRLTISICTITFCLAIPQTIHMLPPCYNLLVRFASTPAPVISITPITATTLTSYNVAACAALAATVGTDQLSNNYDAKC
jgi:hypothetical protein